MKVSTSGSERKKSNLSLKRKKKEIKIRTEINGTENRKTIEKISETKNLVLGKINKINKLLAMLTKEKERRHKITYSVSFYVMVSQV